ncbi:kinase-like protein [Aureobasidium pullulans]|uniref:Kinase-like protein n=1 Tax=Aureobasidium pullulans TaxID=5580 RepID=A0A4S8S7T8_AURPU|nr:kinase-like protein [Aureobasidium pullulans]
MLNTAASSPFMVLPNQKVPSDRHETFEYPLAPRFGTKHGYERLKEQRLAAYQAGPTDAAVNLDGDSTVSSNTPQPNLGEGMEGDLQTLGEVTCPYCLDALPTGQVIEERRWRDHILSDLDPYICLIEGCTQPDVLYTSSDAWVNHLRQHNRYWRCLSHRDSGTFKAREDYIQHLRIQHKMNLHDTKLRALANRNVRYTADLFSSCPLCSDDTTTGDRLLEHITGHLVSLALISLPIIHEGGPGEVAGKKAGFDISQPLSGATVQNLSEDKAATSSDAETLEHNKLDSNVRMNTDDVKARTPMQGTVNDLFLQSLLQHQKDVPSSSVQQSEFDFTLERFLKDVPKLHWMHWDRTKGPAVGLDYEPMPKASKFDVMVGWTSHSYTAKIQLVTADDQIVDVAAKIMRAPHDEALRNRLETLKNLRHKHISAILGTFCLLDKKDKLDYGFLEFPLAGLVLDDLLEEISGYNRYHEQQSLSWSPHHSTHRLLPYFACLCKTLIFLRGQLRPIKHRDIQPMNVLIDQSDNVILTGFDSSQALGGIEEDITHSTSAGTVMYSPKDLFHAFAIRNLKHHLEWDMISLGFVFLEMATVLFGKTLVEMRAGMKLPFVEGSYGPTVSYSQALATGEVTHWLNVLEQTATSTPWKTPQQFAHMTKGRPDYVKRFLDAIRGMLYANRNGDPLEQAWMVFGCLSTHCPSPWSA